jgi:hypothetical protein
VKGNATVTTMSAVSADSQSEKKNARPKNSLSRRA